MPFLTEELWHAVYDGNPPAKSIALTRYPQAGEARADETALVEMSMLQSLIVETRALRKEIGVEEKAVTPIEVRIGAALQAGVKESCAIVERLARVNDVRFVEQISAGLSKHSTPDFDVAVVYERTIDVPAERQLGNESFLAKAPPNVVEGLKKQESETRLLLEKAQAALRALPPG
jgi:valyl-tRNA synthetase